MALVLHDSLDQPSVPGTELGKLGQRVHQLEKIVSDHDQQLRTLDAWSTVGWLLSKDDPLGTTLLTRLQDWNTNRPASGPHPWGPPRRTLAHTLVREIIPHLPSSSAFVTLHQTLLDPAELERTSINFMTVKKTKDGAILLKLRPTWLQTAAWTDGISYLDRYIKEHNGTKLQTEPPVGPLMRNIHLRNRAK